MKFNNSEYELVGEQNGKLIVRVKHMDNQTIEVTSIFGKDSLLDKIIEKEDCQSRQMLAEQLPTALATLTSKQKYAVIQYYCHGMKKNQIAKEMGISKVMAGRHVKAAIKKLRQFYGIEN